LDLKYSLYSLLSRDEAKLPMTVLGILVGIIAGLVVNLFRFVLEETFPYFSGGLNHDDFESLSPLWHFFLPIAGCIVIGQLLHSLAPDLRRMGVSYVIDKVQHFRTRMPVKNAVMQFITACIALLSGGSCGREGPAIHLGASCGGIIGRLLNLPNNSIRLLIASGSAAAIAAAFNTPIAGVIFAMEVILMEYAVSGIIPVIVAAVSGTVLSQLLYGDQPVFVIETVTMNSLWQIPYVVLMGLVIGALASSFVRIHKFAVSFKHIDLRLRLLITGLMTGVTALFIPEVMGTGYDSLNDALQGNLGLSFLLMLLAAKLIVTAAGLGLGLPGGLIGPSLMLGGIAGSAAGIIGEQLIPGTFSSGTFYVLIGMCAMMGATLQAPLAALMALLELSDNPNIILPAMLIIVVANITSSEIFKTRSIFNNTLESGQSGFSPELSRFLNRFGVSTIVNYKFITLAPDAEKNTIIKALENNPDWIVINYDANNEGVISRSALELALDNPEFTLEKIEAVTAIVPVSRHATLLEALEILNEKKANYGYILIPDQHGNPIISGVFSQDDIMAVYKGK